ncbi:hypothetical protein [Enterobacter phage ST22]|nr:hypothetical protein [Enterobacter phage ST22]
MSKITRLISQAIMELQNIHKAVVGVDKRVEAVEQAIAPRTITGARIKEGTITLASMQATAVEAAITGNVPKIQNAMARCHDLPVLTSKGLDEDIERAASRVSYPQTVKVEDCEQGEAAVKAAFGSAMDKAINDAEALDKSPLFPGISYPRMGNGQNSHEYAMGQKATRSGEAYPHLEAMYKAGFGSSSLRNIMEADFTHSADLRHSRVVINRDITPCFVMGLIDALAQARAVAVGADKAAQELAQQLNEANAHLDAAVELQQDLAQQLVEAQKPHVITLAMNRAIKAYLSTDPAEANKMVDAFKAQA